MRNVSIIMRIMDDIIDDETTRLSSIMNDINDIIKKYIKIEEIEDDIEFEPVCSDENQIGFEIIIKK